MPFRQFPGTIIANGTAQVIIQQDNASMEWDVYQVSVNAPATSGKASAIMTYNGFFVTRTSQAAGDTAIGPPDIILSRADIITISFSNANPGDLVNVGVWYTENPAGTTADLSP